MKYIFTFLTLLYLISTIEIKAQDIHFSQFYAEPWLVNPAKTGFFNGNYRLSGAYRNQWNAITSPYTTFSASADLSWELKGANKDIFGMGFHAYSDRAGDANYTINNLGYATSYSFGLDRYHAKFISIGGGVSYINTHFDPSLLKFDNEYTGIGGNEKFSTTKLAYMDFSAGVEYNYVPSDKYAFNLGAAMFHINEPTATYTGFSDSKIHRRTTFNAGATYTINYKFSLYPRLLASFQGPHTEISTGTFIRMRFDKSKKDNYAVYLGSWYRWDDAVIMVARFDIKDISIGTSYDINSSKLFRITEGRGGPELTISYIGRFMSSPKRKIVCPKL